MKVQPQILLLWMIKTDSEVENLLQSLVAGKLSGDVFLNYLVMTGKFLEVGMRGDAVSLGRRSATQGKAPCST